MDIAGPPPTWAGTMQDRSCRSTLRVLVPVDASWMKEMAGVAFQTQAVSHIGPADPKSHTPAEDHATR